MVNEVKWKEVKLSKLSRLLHFISIHIEQAICCVKEFDILSGVIPASVAASAGQSVD